MVYNVTGRKTPVRTDGPFPEEASVTIETLDPKKDAEARSVLRVAFADHPLLAAGLSPAAREELLELLIETFGRTDRAWLHGIRRDGALASVAFTCDGWRGPGVAATVRFFFRLFFIYGWRETLEFMRAFVKGPSYEVPYLELMLLGTLPRFHGQGLGRAMLDFLYHFAEDRGFHGVTLEAVKDSPAYHLYLKEGFAVDGETMIRRVILCNMRRDGER